MKEKGALRSPPADARSDVVRLRFAGGVLEMAGTFSRTLGAGNTQVQWLNGGHQFTDGGFAACGAGLAVTLNGGTATLTWGQASFVAGNRALDPTSLPAYRAVADWLIAQRR